MLLGSGRRHGFAPSAGYAGQEPRFGQIFLSETTFFGGMDDRTAGAMSQTGLVESEAAPSGGFLDSEEIVAALDSLSVHDKFKLKEVEKVFLRGTDLSAGDLLHEAMCAVIVGDRKWPRGLAPMAFIIQTMRSLTSHKRAKHRRETADGGAAQDAADGAAVMYSAKASDPEQILIEQESEDTVSAMQGCFDGDEQAQMLVLGWSEGCRGKELRELVGVDQAALDYVIKRVRRAMLKRYPHGWKKA